MKSLNKIKKSNLSNKIDFDDLNTHFDSVVKKLIELRGNYVINSKNLKVANVSSNVGGKLVTEKINSGLLPEELEGGGVGSIPPISGEIKSISECEAQNDSQLLTDVSSSVDTGSEDLDEISDLVALKSETTTISNFDGDNSGVKKLLNIDSRLKKLSNLR